MNTLVLEETNQGDMVVDVYQRLANDRILFIHDFIDDKLACDVCSTLLLKNSESKKDKITLFINAESGDIRSVFMIYDMMNVIDAPIETVCAGSAWDEALLLLAAGTPGMRYATQNSVVCATQLMYDKMHFSDLTDARIIKDLIKNDNKRMLEAFAKITGKPVAAITKDFSERKFMNPNQAKKYGLIDGIIKNKK